MEHIPLVSICMICYNHDEYIEKAILGVFKQKLNFPVEFIISNDASKDQTSEVIQKLIPLAPSNIQVHFFDQKKNLGMMPNFIFSLTQCKGKYLAICEGDDYWIDENKLISQIDFLESNPDYSLCFHQVNKIQNGHLIKISNVEHKEEIFFEDLIQRNFIHPVSVVFKREILSNELYELLLKSPMGDWPIFLQAASRGRIKLLKKAMANYRMHENGAWSMVDKGVIDFQWGKGILSAADYFDQKYKVRFLRIAAKKFENYLLEKIRNNPFQFSEAYRFYFMTSRYRNPLKFISPIKWVFLSVFKIGKK